MSLECKPVGVVLVGKDIRFDLEIAAGKWQTFVLSREALDDLEQASGDFDRLDAFRKHEDRIVRVAQRMVAAGVEGVEIILPTRIINP